MTIYERVRDLILHPKATWQVIKEEQVETKQLFIHYAAVLALIPAVASLIALTLYGIRLPSGQLVRAPFSEAVVGGLAGYLLQLCALWLSGYLLNVLAPIFGAKQDLNTSMKVVVYAMTPAWVVGVFQMIPGLGLLAILGLYGIYLFVIALSALLETPGSKIVWYALAVLAAGFFISVMLSIIVVGLFYGPMFLRMMAG